MKKKFAKYIVVFQKQTRTGTKKPCYFAFVPTLGIATEEDTFEKAEKAIVSLINFHLDSLRREGKEIPLEQDDSFAIVTKSQVSLPL